jgi:hypothetical protein
MAKQFYPESQLPIRRTVELLPQVFQTESNDKFLSAVLDPLVQPGILQKTVGYVGRRYGKTYKTSDVYLDTDETLRSRYQLEPGVTVKKNGTINNFYDYLDFKNQIKFFGNNEELDAIVTDQEHYSWNPPIDWDKFVNYREYYWVPEGPAAVKIAGQSQKITSTYKIALGTGSVFILTPDGLTNNPTLTLYRGQTYKFLVNAPDNGVTIKTAIDTGTLLYNPYLAYSAGQLTVFDGKLWKAKINIPPYDGSTIDIDSQDWEYVDDVLSTSALDYNKGVTNNGITNGTLTFEVPLDAPDVLFYQSTTDVNRFGRFLIANVDTNTKIDVEKEIVGKTTYTSSNGVELSNGMLIYFTGLVTPAKYSVDGDKWLVEGVGNKITLTKYTDLIVSENLTAGSLEILFDNGGFDSQPFDDASAYPALKDYITISKSSVDSNPWSRYNRWFHRSVLEYSSNFNGTSFDASETARAKRPIIEFNSNLQLFNHGSVAKQVVDYVDTFTTDVFSTIEGSQGYIVDGESLFDGARVLITADTDSLANNQIYVVKFIKHNNSTQINLQKAADGDSILGEGVLVRRGHVNKGLMFHFNGTSWTQSQLKTAVNQPPLFDMYDSNQVSFADADTYPVSSFAGTRILGYKAGTATIDNELGFSLSYLNIDNVGDIQFEFDLEFESFSYKVAQTTYTKNLYTGFFKKNAPEEYSNGWLVSDKDFSQPIIDSVPITEVTNIVTTTAIDWENTLESTIRKILVYVNGIKSTDTFTRSKGVFTFVNSFSVDDVVTFKIFADVDPVTGYYEIPLGLEKNPLNEKIKTFTLGQAADHVLTGIEMIDEFSGRYPGISNLRDVSGYQNKSKRFLKHSNIAPLAMVLLCDKEVNIIKSLQYSKKAYTDFKNTFIDLAYTLYYDQNPLDFVDVVLEEISKTQNTGKPFSESDMIGSGAYTTFTYEVEDEGIKTFALSEKFDLETLSSRAVYIYKNNQQLLAGRDYEFNSTFGFVNLKIDLIEGDVIIIREYVSTSTNFIPPTPTKLGLYKKYTPRKFLDDTYLEPKEVIQGHDGSITVAYGDFRDDVLLELEFRIYNNIKQQYDESLFNNDAVLGGYYGNSLFGKTSLDTIVVPEFLKWIADTNIDYVNNIFFDSEDSFTYTYSNMTDPTSSKNLPGYWRGVYKWFYDTDRPHTCPWEMLGFSEQPDWWEAEYGPAPYTRNNLILWEDLRDGIIRQGSRAGIKDRYKRPSIMSHIPTDGDGNLLSPLDSGLANNFTLINNKGAFVLGDQGPVEAAWRSSSEWPFAVIEALCLLKPFEFITDNFNKSETGLNILGQTINKTSNSFFTIDDLLYENTSTKIISGLVTYVTNYLKSKTSPIQILTDKITGIDVNLTNRLSGFVDQGQQKYVLDSKNPSSTTSSIFVPSENYDIIFNVSSPIYSAAYSGVIIEKTANGWKISGYDSKDPFFNYYQPIPTQTDPVISVGGISENFLSWAPEKFYGNGVVVLYGSTYYRSLKSHTSTDSFELALWKQLPSLPIKNAVTALRRRNYNKLKLSKMTYGSLMTTIQEVVDFLLGYQEYLISAGFVFDGYDATTQTAYDWFTSVKEFMFWSKHNWSEGSLLTLSPSAENINMSVPLGVADNFLDSFYDYQILRDDGTPLQPTFINVKRDFRSLSMSTVNTTAGIYFMRANFVLKEHVVVFDDRTVFNDVIYDKPTGYRQERIKSRGFRTVDWDGDYTSPGFVFDNVNIQVWQPFTDYRLGDIVSYKSYYWTSKTNQLGVENFNDAGWTKLDSTPTKGLVANYDYRINQFEDYYEVDSDGIGSSQRDLARHAIGYQPREYLQGLAEDEISQFRLYQGFIREKGTNNAIVKVFDKISRTTDDSVVLNEEWAFKVGELGGVNQLRETEFEINKKSLVLNPQPAIIVESQGNVILDQNLRIDASKFTIKPTNFDTTINPVIKYDGVSRSAGYVNVNDVDYIFASRDEILNVDITALTDNTHFWITFDGISWEVLRYNEELSLLVVAAVKEDTNVTVTLNRAHNFEVGDIVGILQVANLTGFYKITAVTRLTFNVTTTASADPDITDSSSAIIGILSKARFETYQDVDFEQTALLTPGAKIWVDSNENENWEVIEKIRQYQTYDLTEYGITAPLGTGTAVAYIDSLKQVVTSLPASSYVMVYTDRTAVNQTLGLKQIIPAPSGFEDAVSGVYGEVLAVSPDNKWLAIGSPLASAVTSTYMGELTPRSYLAGEIVLYNGKLWKAKTNIAIADGSSINFNSDDWEPATIVDANSIGRADGFVNQGMVSLFLYADGQWDNVYNFVSPRQATDERFGSAITIGVSGTNYYMAISAEGSMCDPAIGASSGRGRVYLYQFNGTAWSHLENTQYVGVFGDALVGGSLAESRDPDSFDYPAGSIVWYNGYLYQTTIDIDYVSGTTPDEVATWIKLDPVSTQNSLPTNIAVDDDGSTLASGILTTDQLAEQVKDGDKFGKSLIMSRDGSILVVGAPNSDGQYFANYRGAFNYYQEYKLNDVVKWQGGYHRLLADTSVGIEPVGEPWVDVGDSTYTTTGKIFIYERNSNNVYSLIQTITSQSLEDINDTGLSTTINSGDQFGTALDIDSSGTTLIVSSPLADIDRQNQGAVYVLKKVNNEFRLKQKLQSYENYTNEYFGSSVSISAATERIVVGAKNAGYSLVTTFGLGTEFDSRRTTFSGRLGFPGQVYVFERKDEGYFLAEKLDAAFEPYESFGAAVDCTNSVIVVGSPGYKLEDVEIGKVRLFKKTANKDSLNTIRLQTEQIDLDAIKNVELYDNVNNIKIADLDILDPFKLKVLSVAEQDIKFKTIYDPAAYMLGTDDQIIDETTAWFEDHVGEVWWDLSTVKFLNYEQDDLSYRVGHWGEQATGSSVDVYEWVETPLLPSEWSLLADTAEGLIEGISGQPKHADDSVYNVKVLYNPTTGATTSTLYYYWVKNKTILPKNKDRRVSVSSISSYISNPIGTGIPFVSIIDKDKFLFNNFVSIISTDTALVNIEYNLDKVGINPVHREYQLLTEGVADNVPAEFLEKKWIDSLVGFDEAGNTVPDFNLPIKQRYGLSFRPRQTMFANRAKALKIVIDNINSVLTTSPFVDTLSFENLNKKDPIPDALLNQYDLEVDNFIDLEQVGTVKVRQAKFAVNVIDGEIDTIDIIDTGFGYRTTPYITIEGTGTGAKAFITLDSQGRVSSVTVTNRGRKYLKTDTVTPIVKIRPFSVLVRNDASDKNFWAIYSWDQQRRIFYRSKSQGYDVTLYWEYTDWWATGYDSKSRITKEITNFYEEPTVNLEVGTLLRVKEYSNGGWAVLEKTEAGLGNLLQNYNLVGRENGTIRIKDNLYNFVTTALGFDNSVGSYDASFYDLQPIKELRLILKAAKEDIFIDNLAVEWNKLFFSSVRYAFSEQTYIDWAFKTSFLNAIHNIGDLNQRPNYKNDNLDSFRNYIEEVKPYRTTIREYTSRYTEYEKYSGSTTDFDCPPAYSVRDGKILPVGQYYNRLDEYPWKWWADNKGYSITAINVSSGGGDYKTPPTILISGNGTGAAATAFISSGKVSGIRVDNPGSGYTSVPTITLVGGNGTSQNIAKAVAVMGDTAVRTFDITMKFDRISKTGIYNSFTKPDTFVASGYSAIFNLSYAPTRDKSKISVVKNGQIILNNEYEINLYNDLTDGYNILKGKLRFFVAPKKDDVITITYDKNDSLLDAVNRINKYYSPTAGMKGKEINQLMTGIDYGGVQVQGTTFDVTGGWDALPWFTDNWDSVESNSDFYYVVNCETYTLTGPDSSPKTYKAGIIVKYLGTLYKALAANTDSPPIEFPNIWQELTFDLPYTPENNQPISVYIKRSGESKSVRVDDPYYDLYDGVTVQPNGRTSAPETAIMATFIGDGSTRTINIQSYTDLNDEDTIIFRTLESDGSVVITDVNLLDTSISGGTLSALGSAYTTATGLTPEEISIDGGKFVGPDQVPAPEESLPGQVLDSLSIKVFTATDPGAAPLHSEILIGDGSTRIYDIGLRIVESKSVMVYVDKVKQEYNGTGSDGYIINYIDNNVEFNIAPIEGAVIEILSIGIGGIGLLDYQEFVADGETSLFLTKALYDQTASVLVTVDGESIDTGFVNSSEFIDTKNKTMVQFGISPAYRQVVKIICFGPSSQTDSTGIPFIRVNRQTIVFDGTTRTIDLDNFIDLGRSSIMSSMLVEVNNVQLRGIDSTYVVYNGSNNDIILGVDPEEAIGTITSGAIKVYINGELQRFVIDYTYNGNLNLINIPAEKLTVDDIIRIETDVRTSYSVSNGNIVFDEDLALTAGDVIVVTWFSEYPTMNIVTDEFTGGKVNYQLPRKPLNPSYVWVYKNGNRLTQERDYFVSAQRSVVYLNDPSSTSDEIKIVQFGNVIYEAPKAYEVYKDMLNNYYYKRYSITNNVKLVKNLNYYDTSFEVTDASDLPTPLPARNIPGVVIINKERIEYFQKTGNVLSQLRRGSLGTAMLELHPANSYVINSSYTETLPYLENQDKFDFISDGSTKEIGPLEFVPTSADTTSALRKNWQNSWYAAESTIPTTHGPCDEIEVFVAGKRLRKDPISVYVEDNGISSPAADETIDAEFSVDGITPYIRLTEAVPAGTRILVIRKRGKIWYERGQESASLGITLLANDTPIANFIADRATELPE